MNGFDIRYALLALLSVFVSAISQVILKKSAQKSYGSVIREYLNVPVISAYAIFFIATILTVFAYKGIPLSMGAVLEATGYIYVTYFGVKIFHERINKQKIIALVLIISGIIVYSVWG